MAAGAVVAGGVKAGAGGADEAVLVEREYGPRPGLARRSEGTPAKTREQVVAVNHAGPGARDCTSDLCRIKATASQRQCRRAARK